MLLPKIFFVNWFRRDDNNKYIWPGFGENLRVLDWIIKRCQKNVDAKEMPIGFLPNNNDINTSGLNISEETMDELFAINQDQWLKEMDSIEDFFKEYGDRMPSQLFDEHKKVVDSLKEYSSD